MALGASVGPVQRQVFTGTLRLALAGLVLGTLVALAVARLISSLLFATSFWDLPVPTESSLVRCAQGGTVSRRAQLFLHSPAAGHTFCNN